MAANTNTKRRRTNGEPTNASITQNKFKCIDNKSECPRIEGSISVISNDGRPNNVVCSGYLVSAASSEPNHVMIVLELDGSMTPCLFPKDLIDFQISTTLQYIEDKRSIHRWVTDNNIVVESKPAQRRDGVQGHLMMNGLDSTMLESLFANENKTIILHA